MLTACDSTPALTPSTSVGDSPSSAVAKYVASYVASVLFIALLYWALTEQGDGTRLIWYRLQARVAHRVALPISSWGFRAEAKYQETLNRNRTV